MQIRQIWYLGSSPGESLIQYFYKTFQYWIWRYSVAGYCFIACARQTENLKAEVRLLVPPHKLIIINKYMNRLNSKFDY